MDPTVIKVDIIIKQEWMCCMQTAAHRKQNDECEHKRTSSKFSSKKVKKKTYIFVGATSRHKETRSDAVHFFAAFVLFENTEAPMKYGNGEFNEKQMARFVFSCQFVASASNCFYPLQRIVCRSPSRSHNYVRWLAYSSFWFPFHRSFRISSRQYCVSQV